MALNSQSQPEPHLSHTHTPAHNRQMDQSILHYTISTLMFKRRQLPSSYILLFLSSRRLSGAIELAGASTGSRNTSARSSSMRGRALHSASCLGFFRRKLLPSRAPGRLGRMSSSSEPSGPALSGDSASPGPLTKPSRSEASSSPSSLLRSAGGWRMYCILRGSAPWKL